jgi:hypothetical protein
MRPASDPHSQGPAVLDGGFDVATAVVVVLQVFYAIPNLLAPRFLKNDAAKLEDFKMIVTSLDALTGFVGIICSVAVLQY